MSKKQCLSSKDIIAQNQIFKNLYSIIEKGQNQYNIQKENDQIQQDIDDILSEKQYSNQEMKEFYEQVLSSQEDDLDQENNFQEEEEDENLFRRFYKDSEQEERIWKIIQFYVKNKVMEQQSPFIKDFREMGKIIREGQENKQIRLQEGIKINENRNNIQSLFCQNQIDGSQENSQIKNNNISQVSLPQSIEEDKNVQEIRENQKLEKQYCNKQRLEALPSEIDSQQTFQNHHLCQFDSNILSNQDNLCNCSDTDNKLKNIEISTSNIDSQNNFQDQNGVQEQQQQDFDYFQQSNNLNNMESIDDGDGDGIQQNNFGQNMESIDNDYNNMDINQNCEHQMESIDGMSDVGENLDEQKLQKQGQQYQDNNQEGSFLDFQQEDFKDIIVKENLKDLEVQEIDLEDFQNADSIVGVSRIKKQDDKEQEKQLQQQQIQEIEEEDEYNEDNCQDDTTRINKKNNNQDNNQNNDWFLNLYQGNKWHKNMEEIDYADFFENNNEKQLENQNDQINQCDKVQQLFSDISQSEQEQEEQEEGSYQDMFGFLDKKKKNNNENENNNNKEQEDYFGEKWGEGSFIKMLERHEEELSFESKVYDIYDPQFSSQGSSFEANIGGKVKDKYIDAVERNEDRFQFEEYLVEFSGQKFNKMVKVSGIFTSSEAQTQVNTKEYFQEDNNFNNFCINNNGSQQSQNNNNLFIIDNYVAKQSSGLQSPYQSVQIQQKQIQQQQRGSLDNFCLNQYSQNLLKKKCSGSDYSSFAPSGVTYNTLDSAKRLQQSQNNQQQQQQNYMEFSSSQQFRNVQSFNSIRNSLNITGSQNQSQQQLQQNNQNNNVMQGSQNSCKQQQQLQQQQKGQKKYQGKQSVSNINSAKKQQSKMKKKSCQNRSLDRSRSNNLSRSNINNNNNYGKQGLNYEQILKLGKIYGEQQKQQQQKKQQQLQQKQQESFSMQQQFMDDLIQNISISQQKKDKNNGKKGQSKEKQLNYYIGSAQLEKFSQQQQYQQQMKKKQYNSKINGKIYQIYQQNDIVSPTSKKQQQLQLSNFTDVSPKSCNSYKQLLLLNQNNNNNSCGLQINLKSKQNNYNYNNSINKQKKESLSLSKSVEKCLRKINSLSPPTGQMVGQKQLQQQKQQQQQLKKRSLADEIYKSLNLKKSKEKIKDVYRSQNKSNENIQNCSSNKQKVVKNQIGSQQQQYQRDLQQQKKGKSNSLKNNSQKQQSLNKQQLNQVLLEGKKGLKTNNNNNNINLNKKILKSYQN